MHSRILLLCLATLTFIVGCGEERKRPPPTALTVINAARGFTNLNVRRGPADAASIGETSFPGTISAGFDSGPYNFAVETFDPLTGIAIELTTFTDDLSPDQRHVFVLAEKDANIVPVRVARDPIAEDAPTWDLTVFNAAETTANVDFYLTLPGTDLSAATPLGALDFGESLLSESLQPGEFVVTLTEGGNAANVLFTSTTTAFVAGYWVKIVIVPDINGVDGVLSLVTVPGTSLFLTDVNAPARVRLVNGAADMLARDFYVGGDFSAPLAAGVAFAAPTDFLAVPNVTSQISVTPAGNVSVVEAELARTLSPGTTHEAIVAGPAGGLEIESGIDNRRRDNINARILLMNAVSYYETLNVYIVRVGTDLTGRTPNWTLTAPVVTSRVLFPPDTFELTVKDPVSDTVVFGPSNVTLERRGVYTIALLDSGDGTTVSAMLLDDFE